MTTIIIGSAAAKTHFPLFRVPKDYDILCDEYVDPVIGAEIFWDDRLYQHFDKGDERPATLDELYTIKLSHCFWELKNGSWGKHMADLLFFQQQGAVVIEPLYKTLYEIWEEKHGKKKMNLAQSAGMFFTDAVERIYDHDSIHRAVAYTPGKPLYEKTLKDGAEVDVDPKKMWTMSHDELVMMFREEIYATALERIAIPAIERGVRFSPGRAYHWALRRTVTSLLKGKSARFLAENFEEFRFVSDPYGEIYTERFLSQSEEWLVKL